LWLAANGPATLFRSSRSSDASSGEILRVDPESGKTTARFALPGGGGTHGLEYDHLDPGHLWLTTLSSQTLTKVRIADWSVQHVLPLPYARAHGVVRMADGIWVVFTSDRLIVKLRDHDGAELDRIEVPPDQPEPHGLSLIDGDLLFCDATSGWVAKIQL
jgi:streptogramin lyase